jgi:hypothetical protein
MKSVRNGRPNNGGTFFPAENQKQLGDIDMTID